MKDFKAPSTPKLETDGSSVISIDPAWAVAA
jgi:hypothetical protein